MWILVHTLDIRWITETIQDILWLLRDPKMTSVGHPWDKVCCVVIYHFLFCFHQKKSVADVHRIICETYSENVIAIRMN